MVAQLIGFRDSLVWIFKLKAFIFVYSTIVAKILAKMLFYYNIPSFFFEFIPTSNFSFQSILWYATTFTFQHNIQENFTVKYIVLHQ